MRREDKREVIGNLLPPMFKRLNIDSQAWQAAMQPRGNVFGRALVGTHCHTLGHAPIVIRISSNRCVSCRPVRSENDRGTPGSGQIDFKSIAQVLREIDYDGWIVVEAFSRKIPWFAAAVSIWREMSEDPDRLPEDALKYIRSL